MKKIILITILLSISLFATVSATVSQTEVVRGDEVTLNLSASGDDIKFPPINDIAGYSIESSGQSQSITIINGQTTKTLTRSYTFTPLKSITIPSYDIEVDGKVEKTKPINIKVVSQSSSNGLSPSFSLRIISNKSEAYVGEPITLKIIFKQKRDERIEGIQFAPPSFPGFWAKTDGKDRKEVVGNYIIHNLTYILIPQQPGKYKIPAVKVSIAKMVHTQDAFSFMLQSLRWKNIYSNELEINVKPLPASVSVYGHFRISAKVDKTVVNANEPVNLTLTLSGSGNIDDINDFDLKIPSATVYSNKAKRSSYLESGEYKGKMVQKFAIISDKSYTIPPIKFKYFDKNDKRVKTIETKPIKIEVKGSSAVATTPHTIVEKNTPPATTATKREVKVVYKEKSPMQKWIYFAAGLLLGILLSLLGKILRYKKPTNENSPLSYKIKHAKDDKELLKILLPLSHNSQIKEIVDKLEENIYMNKNHKIDKKELSKKIDKILEPDEDDEFED